MLWHTTDRTVNDETTFSATTLATLSSLHKQLQTIKAKYKSTSEETLPVSIDSHVTITFANVSTLPFSPIHIRRSYDITKTSIIATSSLGIINTNNQTPLPPSSLANSSSNDFLHNRKKKALIFTMDSIESYEQRSLHGGAAGEILIRKCLEYALTRHFNTKVDTIRSDAEFDNISTDTMAQYDFIILDPWTWAAPGWVPKKVIQKHQDRIYLLDFFGSQSYQGSLKLMSMKSHVLTAFGSPWNMFLGYYLSETNIDENHNYSHNSQDNNNDNKPKQQQQRLRQGIIWGKDMKHYQGKYELLKSAAQKVILISTATVDDNHHHQSSSSSFQSISNIKWNGHQSASSWRELLASSRFLLGLGHPLLGPSAIDAIRAGCVYINPRYSSNSGSSSSKKTKTEDSGSGEGGVVRGIYYSQHPYADSQIGMPYVCSYDSDDIIQLHTCIDHALSVDLPSFIPTDFQLKDYLNRVKTIFHL